ncbi:MAG: outer membrane protein assembly factor BamD [Rickettsiales bacterium]|nr:MAG: outer membrane protein assembly factor BamD [Rickettsiales bacterium]
MNITKSILIIIASTLILVGCKTKNVDENIITPATELYSSGLKALDEKNYKNAATEFEKVFFQHPGNHITPYAEIMQAYSLYKSNEYEEAIDVLDIFIKLHPRHTDIAYAYYLKALSYYVQISEVKLDQSRTENSLNSLEEVIRRFPSTKYAIDARLKIDLVNDHLAGKEMFVGRYYLNKRNPIAAIKRFQIVVEKFDTTSHTPEALLRLVECNLMLGLVEEAKKYAAVLKHNYPDNNWNNYSINLLK